MFKINARGSMRWRVQIAGGRCGEKKEVLMRAICHARFANTLAQKAIVDASNRIKLVGRNICSSPDATELSTQPVRVHVKTKKATI